MSQDKSIQETHAPNNACFGCGPANPDGLRIRSFPVSDAETVAEWTPEKLHEAFEGMLSGGAIGTLLDCHMNWCCAWHLMKKSGDVSPPCTVTAWYRVDMKRPTPTDGPVKLTARIVSAEDDRCEVEGVLEAGGKVTATGRGLFVAVKPGHPAYHRW